MSRRTACAQPPALQRGWPYPPSGARQIFVHLEQLLRWPLLVQPALNLR